MGMMERIKKKKSLGDFVQDEKSGPRLEWDREGHVVEKNR